MSFDENVLHFFISANTPQGFVSRFEQLVDPDTYRCAYIIKSGPGTGKSGFLKKAAKAFIEQQQPVELIHCSSDPESLDGVILTNKKVTILDGTQPHVVEPKYPLAFERMVCLYDFLDTTALSAHQNEIIRLFHQNNEYHQRISRFLAAAGSLLNDCYRFALDCVDATKLGKYALRLSARELKSKGTGTGQEKVRFLSAVSQGGVLMYTDTAKKLCKKIYVIEDDYGAVSRLLLFALRSYALSAGYDIYSCYCPISPYDKLEHLFIPELELGFMTSNKFHPLNIEAHRVIHARRFTDLEKLSARKYRTTFHRRAVRELLGEASSLLAQAKQTHDKLEQFYISAMDFNRMGAYTDSIISEVMDEN